MSTTQWDTVLAVAVDDDRDHIQGPADAAVTLVEYGDYECPYCGAAYPIVKELQARMGDRLRFVFRNFPITTSHPHAEQAAGAAEASATQGGLGDARPLMRTERHVASGTSTRTRSNWNRRRTFRQGLAEHVHAPRVREDPGGVRSGVNGRRPSTSTGPDTTAHTTSKPCSPP
jgi:hypothetical protein